MLMAFSSLNFLKAVRETQLSVSQKVVLFVLASYADNNGMCWPGTRRICKEAGVSQSTLSRAIIEAKKLKLLTVEKREGYTTTYQLTVTPAGSSLLPQRVDVLPQRVDGDENNALTVTPAGRTVTPAGFYLPAGVAKHTIELTKNYKEKSKPKKKATRFVRPSVEEIQEYILKKNYSVDAEAFHAFYESKGWKVGNQSMKSWQSALVTWEKRNAKNQSVHQRRAEQSADNLTRARAAAARLGGRPVPEDGGDIRPQMAGPIPKLRDN